MSKKVEAAYPIESERDFKAWRLIYPGASALLSEIVFHWRGSSIRVKGKPGHWSVYPISTWCDRTGFKLRKVERELRRLVVDGLIERERHHFEGNTVRTYLRPTAPALLYLGRPQEKAAAKAALAAQNGGIGGGTDGGIDSGTDGGTDLTALPFLSKNSSSLKGIQPSLCEEGKGKAHTKTIPLKKSAASPSEPEPSAKVADGDAAMLAKLKAIKKSKMDKDAKRAALLGLMPIIELAGSKVQHPSEMYPKAWHSWSPEHHLKQYAKYAEYAENAMNKGPGKKSFGSKPDVSGFGKLNFLSKSHKPLY